MVVNKRLKIDLLSGSHPDTVHTVVGDAYSRAVELELRQGREAWPIPDGITVVVEYAKPDGTKGLYDTLPDGTAAWSAEDNVLTINLAPQMLTANGSVVVQVKMLQGDAQLSLFKFFVYVHQRLNGAQSEDYINWQRAFLPQVSGGAAVGQYFEAEEVDADGNVTKIKAVDAPQGGGGQADWNASDGEPGYIANRTHWVEDGSLSDTLEWDGDLTGKTTVVISSDGDIEYGVVKLSDAAPTLEQLEGATMVYMMEDTNNEIVENTVVLSAGTNLMDATEQIGVPSIAIVTSDEFIAYILPSDVTQGGITMPKGMSFTYLALNGTAVIRLVSLKCLTPCLVSGETIHKLDNKYIDAEWMAKKNVVKNATLIPETTHTFTNSQKYTDIDTTFLTVGQTYKVIWNGTEYLCLCQNHAIAASYGLTAPFIGSMSIDGLSWDGLIDNGEPFLIIEGLRTADSICVEVRAAGEVTFSVIGDIATPIKLPAEFLPDEADFSPVRLEGFTHSSLSESNKSLVDGKEYYIDDYRLILSDYNQLDSYGDGVFADSKGLYRRVYDFLAGAGHAPVGRMIPLTAIPGHERIEEPVKVGTFDFSVDNDKVMMWEAVNNADGKLQTYRPVWKKADSVVDKNSERPVSGKAVAEALENVSGGDCIPTPATASVGQTIVVKAVDETGKPTQWEAADFPDSSQNGDETSAEAQLATGTIATETPAGFIDTGITLATLKQYKRFVVVFRGASNTNASNVYLTFHSTAYNSTSIFRVSAGGFAAGFEWINSERNLLRTYAAFFGNPSLMAPIGTQYVRNNVWDSWGTVVSGNSGLMLYDSSGWPEENTLKIYLSVITQTDYSWEVRGLTV